MKVAIIGSGMPALIAAHAADRHALENGLPLELVLYGPNAKQQPAGARFYEREIPGIPVRSAMVSTESYGDADDYQTKIGGPITRYNRARPDFLAFDFYMAYDKLWELYSHAILNMAMDKKTFEESSWDDCDYVFNTAPRPMFYSPEEAKLFAATRHWRLDEVHDEVKSPYVLPGNNVDKQKMIFDGSENSTWYRITQVFGLMTVEWGFHKKPPIAGTFLEILPLAVPEQMGLHHAIKAWRGTEAMAHVGALARWEPSTDIAEVFLQVSEVLNGKVFESNDDDGRGHSSK